MSLHELNTINGEIFVGLNFVFHKTTEKVFL